MQRFNGATVASLLLLSLASIGIAQTIPTKEVCQNAVERLGENALLLRLAPCQGEGPPSQQCCEQAKSLAAFQGSAPLAGCLCNAEFAAFLLEQISKNPLARAVGANQDLVMRALQQCGVPFIGGTGPSACPTAATNGGPAAAPTIGAAPPRAGAPVQIAAPAQTAAPAQIAAPATRPAAPEVQVAVPGIVNVGISGEKKEEKPQEKEEKKPAGETMEEQQAAGAMGHGKLRLVAAAVAKKQEMHEAAKNAVAEAAAQKQAAREAVQQAAAEVVAEKQKARQGVKDAVVQGVAGVVAKKMEVVQGLRGDAQKQDG